MKNASSAYRGTPMPGGRSFTQFRAARIRRVAFQWKLAEQADTSPGADQAEAKSNGKSKGGSFTPS